MRFFTITLVILIAGLVVLPRSFGVNKKHIDPIHSPERPLDFTTADSYVFASILKKSVLGEIPHLPWIEDPWVHGAITGVTDQVLRNIPIPFSETLFHLPTFLALLPALALFFLSQKLGLGLTTAFSASIFSSWSWYFFQRSQSGYLDTDSLALGWPLLILALSLWAISKNSLWIWTFISSLAWMTPFVYIKGIPLLSATLITSVILLSWKEKSWSRSSLLLVIWAISLPLIRPFPVLSLLSFLIYPWAIHLVKVPEKKVIPKVYLIPVALLILIPTIYFSGGWDRLMLFLDRDHTELTRSSTDHLFTYSMGTALEAIPPTFTELGRWTFGHWSVLILSFAGLFAALRKNILVGSLLPYLGLGLLSLLIGRRFSIYLAPPLALGLALVLQEGTRNLKNVHLSKTLQVVLTLILGTWFLYPSFKTPPQPFISNGEMEALYQIKKQTPKEAHVLGWWDDSRAVAFHAERENFLPFNSFGGSRNHWLSRFLLAPSTIESQQILSLLTRQNGVNQLTRHLIEKGPPPWPNLHPLQSKFRPTALYIPFELVTKIGTLQTFLEGPNSKKPSFLTFLILDVAKIEEDFIIFQNSYSLNRKKMQLFDKNGKELVLGRAHILSHPQNRSAHLTSTTLNPSLKNDLVYIPEQQRVLVMDRSLFNSTAFQMGALHLYDPTRWSPIYLGPEAAAFKFLEKATP